MCITFWFSWQVDVIGIDEAQFFEDLYDFCCKAADHDGKIVIVAGLDGDYLRWSSKLFYFSYVIIYCIIVWKISLLPIWCVRNSYWQKELWLSTWRNISCWFCNQVDSSLWALWQKGFLHFEEDKRDTDRTDWWGWCLHACLPPALC